MINARKLLMILGIAAAATGPSPAQWVQTYGPPGGDVSCFSDNGASFTKHLVLMR